MNTVRTTIEKNKGLATLAVILGFGGLATAIATNGEASRKGFQFVEASGNPKENINLAAGKTAVVCAISDEKINIKNDLDLYSYRGTGSFKILTPETQKTDGKGICVELTGTGAADTFSVTNVASNECARIDINGGEPIDDLYACES